MNSIRPVIRLLLIASFPYLVGACGQTLSIKVERICDANADAYIHTERMKDDELAPQRAREVAAELPQMTIDVADGIIASLPGVFGVGSANKFDEIRKEAHENLSVITNYPAPISVGDLRQRVAAERSRLQLLNSFNTPADILLALGYQAGDVQDKIKEIEGKKQASELQAALMNADRATMRVAVVEGEIDKKLKYGGFRSDSLFLINPGSREYEKVMANRRGQRPQLVFSKVEAITSGDSVLLAVQENPAYFTMRYVSADPTEIVRNMLLAVNRVMRVAAAFAPAVQGVGAALGNTKPQSTSATAPTRESTSVDAAESAIGLFDEALRNVNDEELRSLIRKIKASPASLTDEDRAKLNAKVMELMAALGASAAAAPK